MLMVGVAIQGNFGSSMNFSAAFVEIDVDSRLFGCFAIAGDDVISLTVDLVLDKQQGGDNFGGAIFLDAGVVHSVDLVIVDVALVEWRGGATFSVFTASVTREEFEVFVSIGFTIAGVVELTVL